MTASAQTIDDMIEVRPGLRLAVEIAGPPDGIPVLFSNSLAADMRMWDEVADRLGPATRTVRYDTRGHGRSDVPQDGYTLAALGEDVLAIMDALRIERALVCGLSLGGLAAQWLAVNAPDRVGGLVLANTASSFPPPSLWEDRARNARLAGVDQFVEPTLGRWFTPRYRAEHPARVAAIGDVIRATPVFGYAGCCEILASSDLRDDLARIDCPVLVVAGEHDVSTPPARAEEIAASIAGCELARLDAAHLSAVEAADGFVAALAAHLWKVQYRTNKN